MKTATTRKYTPEQRDEYRKQQRDKSAELMKTAVARHVRRNHHHEGNIMTITYETRTENHPNRLDPLEVGTRVRLHSGNDAGTVIGFFPARPIAVVLWDTGRRGAWHVNDLVILAP